jgi:hypothetical protein
MAKIRSRAAAGVSARRRPICDLLDRLTTRLSDAHLVIDAVRRALDRPPWSRPATAPGTAMRAAVTSSLSRAVGARDPGICYANAFADFEQKPPLGESMSTAGSNCGIDHTQVRPKVPVT